jgi:hypothetical protein
MIALGPLGRAVLLAAVEWADAHETTRAADADGARGGDVAPYMLAEAAARAALLRACRVFGDATREEREKEKELER